jgi:hypothetical protein
MSPKTFSEFVASRRHVDNLQTALEHGAEFFDEPTAGYIYADDFYIYVMDDGRAVLTIHNYERVENVARLSALELEGYEWCVDEFDDMRDNADANAARVAVAFARKLRRDIGPRNFAEMCKRNAAQRDPNVCHSHDYCDANMTMAEAFADIIGRPFYVCADDGVSEEEAAADAALWSDAWNMAAPLLGRLGAALADHVARVKAAHDAAEYLDAATHARIAEGAESAYWEENTGGGIPISHSVHVVGGLRVYTLAGVDGGSIYAAPCDVSAMPAALKTRVAEWIGEPLETLAARFDDAERTAAVCAAIVGAACGEDVDEMPELATFSASEWQGDDAADDDDNAASVDDPQERDMIRELRAYCSARGIPHLSADELALRLGEDVAWLSAYCQRWDAMRTRQDAERAP